MDSPRHLSCEPRSLQASPDSQREEEHHALRCVLFLSLKLSPSLRARAVARSAEARGPAPWTPAEEHCPSDSLVLLAFGLAEQRVRRVRYLNEFMTHIP